ncbi:MAG: mechanosensitive ion channel, partial [Planctomycetota bacterium]|nr:mechanosensitive ion channel [Planctomycetota bacterium]
MEPTIQSQDPALATSLEASLSKLANTFETYVQAQADTEAANAAEKAAQAAADTVPEWEWSAEAMQDLGAQALDKLIAFAPKLAGAVAVFFIGWLVARFLKRVLQRVLERSKVDSTLTNFLCSTSYMALMVFVAISAIGQLGVNTASFVAILGAATFAVGFALQGSLANFASGVMMILFRPIRQGDLVEAGGVLGTVEEVGVFATVI